LELQLEQGREREREQQVQEVMQQVAVVEEVAVAFANLYMPEVEKPAHTVTENTREEEEEVRHRLTWLGYQCRVNWCMAN
jgi:hypothetical protein